MPLNVAWLLSELYELIEIRILRAVGLWRREGIATSVMYCLPELAGGPSATYAD